MIDMDKFKEINDFYGHMAGNKVLQDFSKFIKHNLDSTDMLFRFGGDEFCIVLNTIDKKQETIEKLFHENNTFYTLYENKKIFVKFSAGVYTYDGMEEINFNQLIEKLILLCTQPKNRVEIK